MELNREILKSSNKIRRQKIERFLSVVSLVAVAILDISIFVSRLDDLQIKRLDISGERGVATSVVFESAANVLSGRYFGFYPKSNIFLYSKDEIAEKVLSSGTVASVQIARGGDTLHILLREREPSYLWCGELTSGAEIKRCFYLDKDGFSYDKAPGFSGPVFFEFYGGEKRGGYTGKNILPLDQFKELTLLVDSLRRSIKQFISSSAELYGANIKSNGDVDFLARDGVSSWIINGSVTAPASYFSKKMDTAVSSSVFQEETKKHPAGLLYLDLRFGKKVFYKFR
ncbi:MAG: hypothetical protein HZA94_01295 [Candidatus Vogelbacteria bacterium]|nr:hypothetical protein [Candidatus Vogelbacteria bacterium]